VSFRLMDDGQEKDRPEKTDEEAAQMGEVVHTCDEGGRLVGDVYRKKGKTYRGRDQGQDRQ
jgi:hypothetical protein